MAIHEITVNELVSLSGTIRLVDVREDDEWRESHIPFARHVALGTVPDHLDAFGADGDDQPTYVICRAGGRSMRACEFASERSKNVVNVAGGMMAWLDAGFVAASGA